MQDYAKSLATMVESGIISKEEARNMFLAHAAGTGEGGGGGGGSSGSSGSSGGTGGSTMLPATGGRVHQQQVRVQKKEAGRMVSIVYPSFSPSAGSS